MADNQFVNQGKQNALAEWKLKLVGERVNGGKKNPTLGIQVYKNNPRITVRTNVEGDKDYGKINAPMDSPTFFALMALIRQVADGPSGKRYSIDNKNFTFAMGKRSERPVVISTTFVGKNEEGVVYIAVVADGRPKIQFPFLSSSYHVMRTADGSELSKAEASVCYAKGYATMMENLVPHILANEFEVNDFGNKGGGNNNRGGGNGGGYGGQQGGSSGGGQGGAGGGDNDDIPW